MAIQATARATFHRVNEPSRTYLRYSDDGGQTFTAAQNEPYVRLSYLQGTSGAYIDTGMSINNDARVDMEVGIGDTATQCLFCSRQHFTVQSYTAFYIGGGIRLDYNDQQNTIIPVQTGRHTISADGNTLTVDGIVAQAQAVAPFDAHPLTLFGSNINTATSASNFALFKCYSARVWSAGVLVADYIPVRRVADDVCGLLDQVSGVFLPSASGTPFASGPRYAEPGQNLARGTFDFSGGAANWNLQNNYTAVQEKYKGFTVILNPSNRTWNRKGCIVEVEQGKTYTFSFYARADKETKRIKVASRIDTECFANIDFFSVSRDWERYSFTMTCVKTGTCAFSLEKSDDSNLYSCAYKFEEGAAATEWTPAPADQRFGLTPGQWLGTAVWEKPYPPMAVDEYTWAKIQGIRGNDAEYYRLKVVTEKAVLDKDGALDYNLSYNIEHVVGDTITVEPASTSGYYVRFRGDTGAPEQANLTVGQQPSAQGTLSHYADDRNIANTLIVELVKGSAVLDTRIVPVVFDAAASIEIASDLSFITQTVQGHTTKFGEVTNSISKIQQKAESIEQTVKDIRVGGRNLLKGSTFEDESLFTLQFGATLLDAFYHSRHKVVKCTSTGAAQPIYRGFSMSVADLTPGETYTFGISVFVNKLSDFDADALLQINKVNSDGSNGDVIVGYPSILPTVEREWQRVWYTFTLPAAVRKIALSVYLVKNGILYLSEPALVPGNTKEDWSPCPEDTEEAMSRIIQTAESITQQVGNVSTRLDSGGFHITGNTIIDGDLDLSGRLISQTRLVRFNNGAAGDFLCTYINEACDSLVFQNGDTDMKGLCLLPRYDDVVINSSKTVHGMQKNGLHVVLRNAYNKKYCNWKFAGDDLKQNTGKIMPGMVLICTDPRVLDVSFWQHAAIGLSSYSSDTLTNENLMREGMMVSKGKASKFLVLMPGQMVELVSSVEYYNSATQNDIPYLRWYISSDEYTSICCQFDVTGDNFAPTNIELKGSKNGDDYHLEHNIGSWAEGDGYCPDVLCFGSLHIGYDVQTYPVNARSAWQLDIRENDWPGIS